MTDAAPTPRPAEPTSALVSVIVPCFDAGPMLQPALRSIVEQTYPATEIIFVDNNSTDGSFDVAREVAARSARPFTILSCPRQGVNFARNLGFSVARGDFIQWMDADDRIDPDKLALQVAALEADARADIAYGDWSEVRQQPPTPASTRRWRLRQLDDQILRTLAGVWYPPHLYLMRRAAADRLQAMQAWWPGRPVGTDVEYSAMAALAGLAFLHVPGAHVHYNIWSQRQISGATSRADRAATLGEIFQRLKTFAASPACGATLTRRHRALLEQDWGLWILRPAEATLTKGGGRRWHLKFADTPRAIDLRPREAVVARALLQNRRPTTSCHFALDLAAVAPEFADDQAGVVEILGAFQRSGVLVRADGAT